MKFTLITCIFLIFVLVSLLFGTYFLTQGECSSGTFACNDADVCVPQRDICNGHADCPDGEDESFDTCADFHGSQYILNIMTNASTNVTIHTCEHEGVPFGCVCRNHHWIYCSNLNLEIVPPNIVGRVTRLVLANNSISHVSRQNLHYKDLQLLTLEGNGIETLPDDLFYDLPRLEKLFLGFNRISSVSEVLFQNLQHLNMVYLQHNLISFIHPRAFQHLTSLHYLDLSYNRLNLVDHEFPNAPAILELILDGNLITTLNGDEFNLTGSVEYLGLSDNQLVNINDDSFATLPNLTELDLSKNQLSYLSPRIFQHNHNLDKLYLSHNPLTSINKEWFSNLHQLSSIDLRGLDIENIHTGLFDDLPSLRFVYFKRYYYCTFAPTVKRCTPRTDGVSTLRDMLGRRILRIFLWMIATVTCVGNVYVFFGRMSSRDENRSLSWIVRNLADFLMGVYLAIIGAKDMEYRGVYHEESHVWMNSWLCVVSGAIAMMSSEVSIMILAFMSVERFLLIAVPFSGMKALTIQKAYRYMSTIWVAGMAFALLPVIVFRSSTKFYGSNAMCFPLHLDDPYFAGWQISAIIFIFINFCGFVLLSAMYFGMFISIWRTRHATARSSSGEFEFAIRFFFIVLTNGVCWVPVIIMKILTFYGIYMSSTAHAWVAIVVVPVNSAFNPLLYTLTTAKYRDVISNAFSKKAEKDRTSGGPGSYSHLHRGLPSDGGTSLEECSHSLHPKSSVNDIRMTNDSIL